MNTKIRDKALYVWQRSYDAAIERKSLAVTRAVEMMRTANAHYMTRSCAEHKRTMATANAMFAAANQQFADDIAEAQRIYEEALK